MQMKREVYVTDQVLKKQKKRETEGEKKWRQPFSHVLLLKWVCGYGERTMAIHVRRAYALFRCVTFLNIFTSSASNVFSSFGILSLGGYCSSFDRKARAGWGETGHE